MRTEQEIRERLKAITNLKPIYVEAYEKGLLVNEYWECPICGERGGEEMYDHCELCPKVEEEVRVLKWVLGEEEKEWTKIFTENMENPSLQKSGEVGGGNYA